jgi:anti-sigma regulatory factor (Ser/Thr protein kinase)
MMSSDAAGVAITEAVWCCMSDTALAGDVRAYLVSAYGERFVGSDELPEGSTVGIVIADDAHIAALQHAGRHNAGALQSVLISATDADSALADFVLRDNVDIDSVRSVVSAAQDFREQVLRLRADVAKRKSAIGTIMSGHFSFKSLDEARNLATMLALACPNSDIVAVGLQELMVNAVEHGNLEISAEFKQELIMTNGWREEIEARLQDVEYADRIVLVSFQRGERMISITIQDEGPGFDFRAVADSEMPTEGYRGRGIALARELSFSSVAYLGVGNVVQATILMDQDAD